MGLYGKKGRKRGEIKRKKKRGTGDQMGRNWKRKGGKKRRKGDLKDEKEREER